MICAPSSSAAVGIVEHLPARSVHNFKDAALAKTLTIGACRRSSARGKAQPATDKLATRHPILSIARRRVRRLLRPRFQHRVLRRVVAISPRIVPLESTMDGWRAL